jgi:topoisomerase IA-like protein
MGKSCVRFKSLEDLPLEDIGAFIAATSPDQFIAQYEAARAAPRKPPARKTSARKTSARKTSARKTSARKATKKPAARKKTAARRRA